MVYTSRVKESYIREKVRLLEEFHIAVDDSVVNKLSSLYPNEIDVENYTHTLIRNHLYRFP